MRVCVCLFECLSMCLCVLCVCVVNVQHACTYFIKSGATSSPTFFRFCIHCIF